MEGKPISMQSYLSAQLTERYGPLLTHDQLAALLGRTPGGLRYSLGHPADQRTRDLKDCGCRIGRRVYYPAAAVARIISSDFGDQP